MSDWQLIETAPKDGTEILVCSDYGAVILARWVAPCDFLYASEHEGMADFDEPDWFYADFIEGGRLSNEGQPTHWMPLPAPPSDAHGTETGGVEGP